MKRFISFGLFLIFVGLVILRQEDLITIVNTYILPNKSFVSIESTNEYYRNVDYQFVQITDEYSPHSFNDIINLYYTVINAGQASFTFYCPRDYDKCLRDVQIIANDQSLLSDINNYIHPFNGFSHIETQYDTLGRVTISMVKSYRQEEIKMINDKIDELLPQITNGIYDTKEQIRAIHDYIINNTKYDSLRSDFNQLNYKSDTAYGPLFEGYALCGGYTDLMALFLERLNVKNFKVSSEKHVWNAVYLDDKWYHLDLTWDDPVSMDGSDYLTYDYFLVTTQDLLEHEKTQHNFNQDRYPELLK